jgi:hypothetical protein
LEEKYLYPRNITWIVAACTLYSIIFLEPAQPETVLLSVKQRCKNCISFARTGTAAGLVSFPRLVSFPPQDKYYFPQPEPQEPYYFPKKLDRKKTFIFLESRQSCITVFSKNPSY